MAIDPSKDLNGFIDQWYKAGEQYHADYSQLLTMIQQMLALAKKGEIGEAFQMGQMVVMPGAMQVQGDSMAKLAASMNIASALEEFTTEAQKDMNGGGSMTNQQGEDFVKYIKAFFKEITTGITPPWLDAGTKTQLIDAITKICTSLGFTGPNDPTFTGKNVAATIKYWTENPNGTQNQNGMSNPGGKTGQQCLQALQAGFTQWNNTESAQSQVLQSQEQFQSNIFNQYMNTCTDIFQASQKQAQMMVQNQKTQ